MTSLAISGGESDHRVSESRAIRGRLPHPFGPGYRFGPHERYEVVDELGAGSTAIALLVRDAARGGCLVAKLMRTSEGESPEDALARALGEARTLEKLRHQNIVKGYGAGDCNSTAYVLLEYRAGIPLDALLEKGPLPAECALGVALTLARALEHAHAAGVLHLDVKPGNVWVTRSGRIKLLDFGIHAELERARRETRGGPTLLFGTPAYMAPEQWRLMVPDARSDVWALGVTLYELLTGRMPFAEPGTHPLLLLEAVLSNRRPPCVAERLKLPRLLDAVLNRALAKEPPERFQTMTAFLRALATIVREMAAPRTRGLDLAQELSRRTPDRRSTFRC